MTTGPLRALFLGLFLLIAAPACAQSFPPLSGRVVDQADLLQPEQEAALTQRLEALERASSRQLVVATVSDLQGHDDRGLWPSARPDVASGPGRGE